MVLEQPSRLVYEASRDEELYRSVTANADLDKYNLYQWEGLLTAELVFGGETDDIDDEEMDLSAKELLEFKVAREKNRKDLDKWINHYGGINLCHDDNPRHEKYPGIRIWKTCDGTQEPLATDLIVTGAGVLRPNKIERRTLFEKVVRTQLDGGIDAATYPVVIPVERGQIASILATHLVAYEFELGQQVERTSVQQYHSTNRVYGDVYGELEQLWRRRDNKSFLRRYLRDLKATWKQTVGATHVEVIPGYGEKALARLQTLITSLGGRKIKREVVFPVSDYRKTRTGRLAHRTEKRTSYLISDLELCGFTHLANTEDMQISDIGGFPRGYVLYLQHLSQFGVWRKPPETIEELVARVELLLSNIEVNKNIHSA